MSTNKIRKKINKFASYYYLSLSLYKLFPIVFCKLVADYWFIKFKSSLSDFAQYYNYA